MCRHECVRTRVPSVRSCTCTVRCVCTRVYSRVCTHVPFCVCCVHIHVLRAVLRARVLCVHVCVCCVSLLSWGCLAAHALVVGRGLAAPCFLACAGVRLTPCQGWAPCPVSGDRGPGWSSKSRWGQGIGPGQRWCMGPLPAAPQTSRFPQAPPSSGGPWETMGEPVGRAWSAGSERDTPHPVGCTAGLRAQPLCPTRPLRPGVTGCREVRLCPVGKPWAGRRPAGLSKRLSTTPGTRGRHSWGDPGPHPCRSPVAWAWAGWSVAGSGAHGVSAGGTAKLAPGGSHRAWTLGAAGPPGEAMGTHRPARA